VNTSSLRRDKNLPYNRSTFLREYDFIDSSPNSSGLQSNKKNIVPEDMQASVNYLRENSFSQQPPHNSQLRRVEEWR
jgi:hypothetical protein